jgi:hypothetical protein
MAGSQTLERRVGYSASREMSCAALSATPLLVPAFIEFDSAQMGNCQFGTVRGWLDGRFGADLAGGVSKGIVSKDDCIPHCRCVAPNLSRSITLGAGTMSS